MCVCSVSDHKTFYIAVHLPVPVDGEESVVVVAAVVVAAELAAAWVAATAGAPLGGTTGGKRPGKYTTQCMD